ncbi:cytochrome o ubiquinol oxidase protein CyoD [Waddlia chondrophila 2032/99]|uniref:Cytochrome bo(3) ubiquinol oxidase subunit 4 n=2 Tax=Waddlia chondrophila TaxID=71667 RepID=D6YUP6_WADCW|nr:cytochrome o ubiquinol oxidase subunit IV [Waddlia chondrophila]ADI37857.1 putative cytochrome o ubiquinol oxidase, subunit IV [Waddlia chondrophila WSU 86-1044]CCB92019.1 cytochrome o ubiquinol oxidase protein CyoD [Waddlia chondrophila 2032/99]
MSTRVSLNEEKKLWHGTYLSYGIGFFVSLVFTSISFLLVAYDAFPPVSLIYTIATLAFLQAVVQLIFFLHLGQEGKPHWETFIFFFMLLILLIIVVGSLWVMNDLNERMMPKHNMTAAHHD